ncbi:hypothetical protein HDU91_006813, partial [Kappamyces sp. JEL0680]
MEYIAARDRSALSPEQLQATEIEAVRQKLQSVGSALLTEISVFQDASIDFLHSLSLQVQVERYEAGSIIFKEGHIADS